MVNVEELTKFLVGKEIFYVDEESGIGWDIKVEQLYHSFESPSIYLLITDEVKVKLSHFDIITNKLFTSNFLYKKIIDTYKESLDKEQ